MAWALDRTGAWRLLLLALGSMLGVGLGLWGDFVVGDPLFSPPFSVWDWLGRVFVALLLSPFTVTVGGFEAFHWMPSPLGFVLGGCGVLFWSVYPLLVWRWMKTGAFWWLGVIVLWCVQGFFALLHRLELIMSV